MNLRALLALFFVVAVVVGAVHHGTLEAAVSHDDRLLVAAAAGGAALPEDATLTQRIGTLEALPVGARSSNYRWIGLILLAIAATALGVAVRRVLPGRDDAGSLPVDAGLLAAAMFAAAPIHVDSTATLPGHVRLAGIALACVGVALARSDRRIVIAILAVACLAPVIGGEWTRFGERFLAGSAWAAAPAAPAPFPSRLRPDSVRITPAMRPLRDSAASTTSPRSVRSWPCGQAQTAMPTVSHRFRLC